jgi:ABC-type transport system substrate-binding protein
LEIEYRATGTDAQTIATVVADFWKRIGVDTRLNFVSRARSEDNEWMAKYPGVRNHDMVAAPVGGARGRFDCASVPSERNAWVRQSTNPSMYCAEEMERWATAMDNAFPFSARMEPFREMQRIALRDLPYLPLYFEAEVVPVRANVGGVNRIPPKNRGRLGMLAHTWTIQ